MQYFAIPIPCSTSALPVVGMNSDDNQKRRKTGEKMRQAMLLQASTRNGSSILRLRGIPATIRQQTILPEGLGPEAISAQVM